MQLQNSRQLVAITKSLLWNSIIEIFQEKKSIDISPYLVSIKKDGSLCFVKTNNPLIKGELLLLEGEIKSLFSIKLKKVGISLENIEIKYV